MRVASGSSVQAARLFSCSRRTTPVTGPELPIGATGTDEPWRNEIPMPRHRGASAVALSLALGQGRTLRRSGPVLAAALGDHAPKSGETIEVVRLRAGVENGPALAAAVEKRETFAGLTVAVERWRRRPRSVHYVFGRADFRQRARIHRASRVLARSARRSTYRMQVSAPNALAARAKAESDDEPATVEPGHSPGPKERSEWSLRYAVGTRQSR